MHWLASEGDLSVATISRHLAIINAALRRAAKPTYVTTPDGKEVEQRILLDPPEICYAPKKIAEVLDRPEPQPRAWLPSLEELGRFIDAIESEALFRYTILALNTWGRPEAICDVDPARQLMHGGAVLDLNPPGRRQNKKYRPKVRVTDCLAGWLRVWPQSGRLVASAHEVPAGTPGDPPTIVYKPVASVRKAFETARERVGLPQLTRYSLRHLLASRADNDPQVPQKEVDLWMGHRRPEEATRSWYRHYDPNYLREAKAFTDRFMVELQQYCRRSLFAPADGVLVPLIPQRERIRRQGHANEKKAPPVPVRIARGSPG